MEKNENSLMSFFKNPLVRVFFALALIFCIGLIFNADGAFLKWATHRDMLRQVSVYGILACGMTIVIISGGIDLSVGSILALSAVIFSILTIHLNISAFGAIIFCVLTGIACGIVSGVLAGRFKIQPFIATLAMMVFARGMAKFVSGGEKISTAVQQADGTYKYVPVPQIFNFISSGIMHNDIAVVSIIFIVCLLISWFVLAKLRWGRYIYAIGGNEEATRLSGIPIIRMKMLAYGLCGFFCAIAGICQAAQELQGDPEAGAGYELTAIAMVVIGGTSLNGGRGGILLTLLGALTIGYLDKILSINAIGISGRLMLTGTIIVAAVLFQKKK